MDYQKLLTEEQISNIYVAEGDIVSGAISMSKGFLAEGEVVVPE